MFLPSQTKRQKKKLQALENKRNAKLEKRFEELRIKNLYELKALDEYLELLD